MLAIVLTLAASRGAGARALEPFPIRKPPTAGQALARPQEHDPPGKPAPSE